MGEYRRLTKDQRAVYLANCLSELLQGVDADILAAFGVFEPTQPSYRHSSKSGAAQLQDTLKIKYKQRYEDFEKKLRDNAKVSVRLISKGILNPDSPSYLTLANLVLDPCKEILDMAVPLAQADYKGDEVLAVLRKYIGWNNGQGAMRKFQKELGAGLFLELPFLKPIRTRTRSGIHLVNHLYEHPTHEMIQQDPEKARLMQEFDHVMDKGALDDFEHTPNPRREDEIERILKRGKRPKLIALVLQGKLRELYGDHYQHAGKKLANKKAAIAQQIQAKITSGATSRFVSADRFRAILEDSGSELGLVE